MKSLKGHLLAAAPELLDENFHRAVVLIIEHTEEGAVGVLLNRPTDSSVTSISEQIFRERFDWDKPIHLGGPVRGPMMAIHTEGDLSDQEVFAGLFSSAEAENVQKVLRRKAEPCLVVANYAGWGPGQLEGEIGEGSWAILPARLKHVFWRGRESLWDAVHKEIRSSQFLRLLKIEGAPEDTASN
jgi:putative transcriptional regulator